MNFLKFKTTTQNTKKKQLVKIHFIYTNCLFAQWLIYLLVDIIKLNN
jgi:hypothetical protein